MVNITNSARRGSPVSSARRRWRFWIACDSKVLAIDNPIVADHRMSSSSCRLNVTSMRFISCTARSECPPRSKKLSRTPIERRFRRSCQILTRCSSTSSRGATIECSRPSLAAIGAGASRSILPLALSGSAGRKTNAEGSM